MRNTTFKISKREVPSIYDHMQHFKKLITEKDSQLCWQCIVFRYEFYRKYFSFASWAQHVMTDAREVKKKKNNNEESRFNFHIVSTRF